MTEKKKKEKKEKKEKKKKLPFKRTVANNLFALRIIFMASPLFLTVYIGSSFIYGILDFLSEGYLLRRIVNGIESGESLRDTVIYAAVLGTVTLIAYILLQWFWNVTSRVRRRRNSKTYPSMPNGLRADTTRRRPEEKHSANLRSAV